MDGLTSFKNEIFKYGAIIAVIIELASLPILGLDVQFFYGLALGTTISIVNFNIMALTFRLTLEQRKSSITFLGYLIRLAVYGGAFYVSIKVSPISGLGTALGFFTIKLALIYLYGFRAKFSKGRVVREEPSDWKPKKHWYDYKEYEDYDE